MTCEATRRTLRPEGDYYRMCVVMLIFLSNICFKIIIGRKTQILETMSASIAILEIGTC